MARPGRCRGLKARIAAGDVLIGTFLKTPTPHVVELLDLAGLDFAVPDQEHAPIGIETLDLLAVAARGLDFPLIARVPQADPLAISRPLDAGMTGVMVPHVGDGETATDIVAATRHMGGRRGFSPSGRGGGYGSIPAPEQRRRAVAETVVMAQIENRSALANIDAIASSPGIDVLFIGPADLSLAMGHESHEAPEVQAAIDRISATGARHGVAVGLAVATPEQITAGIARGIRVFVAGSDQGFLLAGARQFAALRPA